MCVMDCQECDRLRNVYKDAMIAAFTADAALLACPLDEWLERVKKREEAESKKKRALDNFLNHRKTHHGARARG